ncbi:MAG: hypothetical protein NPIRA04_35020 [Nitrospirales bacterium]|nr:MAG: hypothetical protein NPIRA04_35020 [Nitrospirales bacterium]
MKHVLAVLLTGMFLLGTSSLSSALDLDMKKMTDTAEEAKKEASEKAQDVAERSEEKKAEGKSDGMMGDIKAKGKEMIKEKVDGM